MRTKNEAAHTDVHELRHQLETANAEISGLKNQLTQQEMEAVNHSKDRNDITNERDQLLQSLDGERSTIKRLQFDMKLLEEQLQSVVSEKDAMACSAESEAKTHSLEYREKQIKKGIERLNSREFVTGNLL